MEDEERRKEAEERSRETAAQMKARKEAEDRKKEAEERRKEAEGRRLAARLAIQAAEEERRVVLEAKERAKTDTLLEKKRTATADLERTLLHVRAAEAALLQAKKALSRGDIEGAAAMRMTAADEFRLAGQEREHTAEVASLGQAIRSVAHDQLLQQQHAASAAHAAAEAARSAAQQAEAAEALQAERKLKKERRQREHEERRRAIREGRDVPPPTDYSYERPGHNGPYSPAAKAEAAQRKREEKEAAQRAAAVEEEALRIVNNIQNFLEKFDPSLRFLTSRH